MKLIYIIVLLSLICLGSSILLEKKELSMMDSSVELETNTALTNAYMELDEKIGELQMKYQGLLVLSKDTLKTHSNSTYLKGQVETYENNIKTLNEIPQQLSNAGATVQEVEELANHIDRKSKGMTIWAQEAQIRQPQGEDSMDATREHKKSRFSKVRIQKRAQKFVESLSSMTGFQKVNATLDRMISEKTGNDCGGPCGNAKWCVNKQCVEIRWASAKRAIDGCTGWKDLGKALAANSKKVKNKKAQELDAELKTDLPSDLKTCIESKMSKDAAAHFQAISIFGTAAAGAGVAVTATIGAGYSWGLNKFFVYGQVCGGKMFNIAAGVGGGLQLHMGLPETGDAETIQFALGISIPGFGFGAGIACEFEKKTNKFAGFALALDFSVSVLPVTVMKLDCLTGTKVRGARRFLRNRKMSQKVWNNWWKKQSPALD